ncbi:MULTISPECIES: beta-glucuronidase [unclassified Actinomyces]|uniref:beta-glucuronidase n=1 Tax=unclassified Actinomyces TaxID=2609248 RepID=UPI0020179B6B|nr:MULTISPECIES: beta-glucuronidase [unclassified Actinomyces]MCL3778273.1 beta-glucuronidase [Actinomyces sp. AC-20-1]MCL3788735.1 beta-glucuronidase [Actinomyces sp. 187325]MCL3791791.1 beta-glucuronidase [Actinomyces sp. 186855]MCL3794365.1 beta-glucuronidase [Actinomyces sp. 217892]
MLSVRQTPSRDVRSLDGVWRFQLDPAQDEGLALRWFAAPLPGPRPMPVPASYNDVTTDVSVHDHVGLAWYQREVQVPSRLGEDRLVLRFGSVTHHATVWVDDVEVATHAGGYLPFEADITEHVRPGGTFRLTVAVDNRLSWQTIPPGYLGRTSQGRTVQRYFHDFYNYAGIHRSVSLVTRPAVHVSDVTVVTGFSGEEGERTGTVGYTVTTSAEAEVGVRVLDADGTVVATAEGATGTVEIPHVTLWRPGRGHLYTLEVTATADGVSDVYPQRFGVRTVEVRDSRFLINGEPFYFRGYGRHEDNIVRGKGHDDVLMVHDFELMRWQGANSFRTSHYPYAEEVMDLADELGLVVIDETPAVGLNTGIAGGFFASKKLDTFSPATVNDATRDVHVAVTRELIARDKNHPSVVLWSVANEPESATEASHDYFAPVAAAAREADPTRPVGYVNFMLATPDVERLTDLFDVIMVNRYYGWYVDTGDLEAAEAALRAELEAWVEHAPGQPILFCEYGADTMLGLRDVLARPWSEDFQRDMLAMYHRVFDDVDAVQGEQMWNFADFQTSTGINRVGGNKKGMFARDRSPKAVAYEVRRRWLAMREQQGC